MLRIFLAVCLVACAREPAEAHRECEGKLSMAVERFDDDGNTIEAAGMPYAIHLADEAAPRRLGRLVASGHADAHGHVSVAKVACENHVIAFSGVDETATILVLPFEDREPQAWLVQR